MDLLLVVLLGTVFVNLPQYIITQEDKDAKTNFYKNEITNDGYNFNFETDNGIQRMETGAFENGVWTVRGSVYWTGPDFLSYGYEYIADDKGYRQTESGITNKVQGEAEIDVLLGIDPKTSEGLLGG